MQRRLTRPAAEVALKLLATLGFMGVLYASSSYYTPGTQLQHDEPGTISTLDVTEVTLSAATSGCGLCQQTGLCDHAFKGSSGQFCLTLVSGLPCCCPQDAQCVVSNSYNCRCRRVKTSQQPHYSSTTTTTTTTSSMKPSQLLPLFVMLLCVLCCVCAARDSRPPETAYPANQHVYVTPQYGATQDTRSYQYGYPSAPPASPYDTPAYDPYAPYTAPVRAASPRKSSSGNAFASGAIGAAAGFATGMLAGSMFGGGGNRSETTTTTTTSYFGGDAGFDFSGDTGGDDGGDFGGDS